MRISDCFFVLLLACSACQKDRLTGSTFAVQVSPTAAAVPQGSSKTFTVALQGSNGSIDGLPTWAVQPVSLGVISPTQGSQVTFTSGSTPAKTGTISATFKGVTGSAQIFVGGSVPGGGSSTYGLFIETLSPPGIKFDTSNPPDPDGGSLCAFQGGGGSSALSNGTAIGEFTEGTKSLKCAYNAGGSPGTAFGGWFIQFGSNGIPGCNPAGAQVPHDFSSFSGGSLKFDVRSPQEVRVKIEWTGGSKELNLGADLGVVLDDTFHAVSIPLSSFTGITLSAVKTFVFSAGVGTTSFTYPIDNMRLEK